LDFRKLSQRVYGLSLLVRCDNDTHSLDWLLDISQTNQLTDMCPPGAIIIIIIIIIINVDV